MATDKDCSWNEMWHWTNDEIGVAVQSFLWVWVELMIWQLSRLEHLNENPWSRFQIPARTNFYCYFKEFFSGEYHMDQFIPLHLCDYLKKNVDQNKRGDWRKAIAEMKCETGHTMKLEYLHKFGSDCELNSWPDSSIG